MHRNITRRQAIKIVSGVLLLPFACTASEFSEGNKVVFAYCVASGDPDQNSVVIWTRVSGLTSLIKVNQSVIAKSIAPNLDDPILNNLLKKLSLAKQQKLVERTHIGKYSLPSDLDTWSGYPAARERFYQIVKDGNVQDLLVISGDSHSYWQNVLFDDDGQSMGVELGASGVTSPRSIMESLGSDVMKRFDDLNTANNEEIIWSDGRHRGFIRLQVNHKGTHADYVTVSNVESRTYETQVLRFVCIINPDGLLQYEE